MEEEAVNSFSADERTFAGLILELENNAMLRMILINQEKIMSKLGLVFDASEVYDALAPIEKKVGIPDNDRFSEHIGKLTQLRMDRLWEWIKLNLTIEGNDDKKRKD